jgi:hypothetical protein
MVWLLWARYPLLMLLVGVAASLIWIEWSERREG